MKYHRVLPLNCKRKHGGFKKNALLNESSRVILPLIDSDSLLELVPLVPASYELSHFIQA